MPVTVSGAGALTFNASTMTTRTFNLNSGTLTVPAGVTLTLNGASVVGGFLRGAGTYAVTGGTTLTGVTTLASTIINQTGSASYTNFTNGGTLTIAASVAGAISLNGFTNQGSGSITIGGEQPGQRRRLPVLRAAHHRQRHRRPPRRC